VKILVLSVPIVSKSSFLFLSVAFLAAAANRHSGGVRLGEVNGAVRYEARADIASLNDDVHELTNQAVSAPTTLRKFWERFSRDFRTLEADAAADARAAAQRLSDLVRTT
jgi:hypothetical protein